MNDSRNRLVGLVVVNFVLCGIANSSAQAVELLTNGDLEAGVGPQNWTVEQTVTGLPGAAVNASEQIVFANNPPDEVGGLGIFLRPFAGNQGAYQGQNQRINFIMSQTVNATAGRTYTLTGDSYFAGDGAPGTEIDDGYSGGVTTLHAMSPTLNPAGDYNENGAVDAADYVFWRKALGEDPPLPLPREAVSGGVIDQADYNFWRSRFGTVAGSGVSPTETTFEMEFLDAGGNVLDTPFVLDLRTEQMNDAMWRTHTLMGTAPPGTAQVRVTAAARDMVENFGFQNAYLDNFSLRDSFISSIERLQNADLNVAGEPAGFTITEIAAPDDPDGVTDTISFRDFADHTHYLTGSGAQGIWVRAFEGGDGIVSQTVAAMPGADYEFSAWSAWEVGYAGGFGDPNVLTFQRMEFLDASSMVIGSPLTLDLAAAGQVNDANDGGPGEEPGPGIELNDWRQFTLDGTAPAGTAFVRVSVGATGLYDSGFNPQSAFFDDLSLMTPMAGSGGNLLAGVPEPGTCILAMIAALGALANRRSRWTM